jgi:metal-responsive CopG/Arc/MetJ family transcriptional regulator
MPARRSSRVIAVSVPPAVAVEFERVASHEGRNRSELFREMLRVYLAVRETETFESLQRYGAARARRRGVLTIDDVRRIVREARS